LKAAVKTALTQDLFIAT